MAINGTCLETIISLRERISALERENARLVRVLEYRDEITMLERSLSDAFLLSVKANVARTVSHG